MIVERLDRRALGAIEFVNATTRVRVTTPLRVTCPGVTLVRNTSGLYIVREARGFENYVNAFDAPPAPPAGDPPQFTLVVEDLDNQFLPRGFTLTLPRKIAPPSDKASVLSPLPVELFPAASMQAAAAWALLRARVQIKGDPKRTGLANVLLQVTPQTAGLATQTTLTDADGEALVAIPGASPIMANPGGEGEADILTSEFAAAVRVVADSAVVRPSGAPSLPIADPQSILRRADPVADGVSVINPPNVALAAGKSKRTIIEVTWP